MDGLILCSVSEHRSFICRAAERYKQSLGWFYCARDRHIDACVSNVQCSTSELASCRTAERYKQFFGVIPDAEIDAEADKLKQRGDFTDPPSDKDFQVCCIFEHVM